MPFATTPDHIAAFADIVVPGLTRAMYGDTAAMARHYAARDAATAKVRAELIGLGASEAAAAMGSGAFMTFGFAPGYGLGDANGQTAAEASRFVSLWVATRMDRANARVAA